MQKITEVTKRDIFKLFRYGIDVVDFFEARTITYNYYGSLSELDFLKRIYNLADLPSYDSRYENAESDIWCHTVLNDDYPECWVFEDERFNLLNGSDEELLKFLCAVFHPAVRVEMGYWKEYLAEINSLLNADGYELYASSKISGRDVYDWREYDALANALFIPFSERYKKEIADKTLKMSISKKARRQILAVLNKFTEIYRETDETGWDYDISTDQMMFRDVNQFYQPKAFNEKNEFVDTSNLEEFILNSRPYCVFDAIEVYEKYNKDNDFASQVNALLKLNDIGYKLEQGKMLCSTDVVINRADVECIGESGLKKLISEAVQYYSENNKRLAVEKLWDAFERMKTYYYPELDKAKSADRLITNMSGNSPEFKKVYEEEFRALTKIGNDFRIRHHETNRTDIVDDRQYDYFYKRCLALISVAILYL